MNKTSKLKLICTAFHFHVWFISEKILFIFRASVAGAAGRKRRSSVFQRANRAIFQTVRSSPILRGARAWFRQTKSYLEYKTKMIKLAIEEFKQKVKRKLSKEYIKEKIKEKMDDLSCLTTRLEFYGKLWKNESQRVGHLICKSCIYPPYEIKSHNLSAIYILSKRKLFQMKFFIL